MTVPPSPLGGHWSDIGGGGGLQGEGEVLKGPFMTALFIFQSNHTAVSRADRLAQNHLGMHDLQHCRVRNRTSPSLGSFEECSHGFNVFVVVVRRVLRRDC